MMAEGSLELENERPGHGTKAPEIQQDAYEQLNTGDYTLEICCVCGDWADYAHGQEVIMLCSNNDCEAGLDAFGGPSPAAIHIMCLNQPVPSLPDWDWFCCLDCENAFKAATPVSTSGKQSGGPVASKGSKRLQITNAFAFTHQPLKRAKV